MAGIIRQPCDEGVIRSSEAISLCTRKAGPWVLAATILGSSMAFIDETAVTVALPAIQKSLGATAVDAQWVVAVYTLLLAALILVGGSLGDPPDLYDSDFALAQNFWDTVSTEIQDGRVMFELWNEPVKEDELPPSDQNSSKWSELKPYFENLISIIRANGSESVILATGNHWAYNLKGIKDDPLDDPNTAYTWHVYAGHEGNDPSRWAAALDGLHTVKPVVVTEWGFQPRANAHYRGTAKTFGIKFRDRFLQGRGLHSTAWCWSASYGPSLFKRDWRTRTVWRDFAYDYLRARNRDPVRP